MGGAMGDPYLWSALAALFLGLALGQALRWASRFLGSGPARARGPARSARALAFAALALLPAAALLVYPSKASLADPELAYWTASVLGLGALAGFWPRAAGIPLAAALAAALAVLGSGLSGWVEFGGPGPLASLLPYEVLRPEDGALGDAVSGARGSFRGELELAERDSVPIAQSLAMASAEVAVAVESIELGGPLRLAAAIAGRGPGGRFYRVVGLVAPGAERALFPGASALLDPVAPLAPELGFEPGAPAARAEALLGFFLRRRGSSEGARLVSLEPARFSLDAEMSPLLERRRAP